MASKQGLPVGWVTTELGELGKWTSGGTPLRNHPEYFGGSIPWVLTGDLDDKLLHHVPNTITEKGLTNSSAKLFPTETLLVAMYGATIGKLAVLGLEATTNQACAALLPSEENRQVLPYIFYFLLSERENLKKAGKGGAQPNISLTLLKQYPIPLAPLNEQRRIVSKIEELFSRLDEGEAALQRVQKLLASYRQAVLKAAVTGELTKEWREANQHRLESGEELLQRILKARRSQWQGRGQYQEPQPPSTHNLPTLPELWTWTSLESLVVDGPTNGLSLKPNDSQQGVKSFKLTATTSGEFIISGETIKYLDTQLDPDSKYWLKTGDLLIQRGNTIEYVGTAATFPGPDNEYVYPDLMMRIRISSIDLTRWVNYWTNFRYARDYFRGKATGIAGNMPKINGETLKALPVPLPPEEEITFLVSELDRLSAIASSVNKTVKTETNTSATLRQSILKAAFSGKLVPQDSTDESVSVLLERIQGAHRSPNPSKPIDQPPAKTKLKLQPSLWEPS